MKNKTVPQQLMLHDEFIAIKNRPPHILQHFFFIAFAGHQQFGRDCRFIPTGTSSQSGDEQLIEAIPRRFAGLGRGDQ